MHRIVEPELLDSLPPDDPRAMRSRRDLARINGIMRQPAMMAREIAPLPPARPLIDLGGGDGRFMLAVARRLKQRRTDLYLADRQNILAGKTQRGFAAAGWNCRVLQGDIFQILPIIKPGSIVTANLFLHHFQDEALKSLLALVAARADAFIACEPRRSPFALFAAKQLRWIGANAVTRHDAMVSVRAGFSGNELGALWPAGEKPGWTLREGPGFAFSHCFTAIRNGI